MLIELSSSALANLEELVFPPHILALPFIDPLPSELLEVLARCCGKLAPPPWVISLDSRPESVPRPPNPTSNWPLALEIPRSPAGIGPGPNMSGVFAGLFTIPAPNLGEGFSAPWPSCDAADAFPVAGPAWKRLSDAPPAVFGVVLWPYPYS